MKEEITWLRDEYALESFKFFIHKYFDKSFEEFAVECGQDIPEMIASLCYLMADEMIKRR